MQDCRFPVRLYKPRNLWILSYHGILFEDSKKYIDRSQFWQTQYFMYIILKIIWGVSHHIACHLLDWIWDISSRHQGKETAGLGLGSNRSCSLWSYAWSLDFRCFKIDNRGREGDKYSSIILFTTVNSAFDIDNLILSMFDIIRCTMYMKKKQMRGRIHPLLLYFECCEIQTPCIKS